MNKSKYASVQWMISALALGIAMVANGGAAHAQQSRLTYTQNGDEVTDTINSLIWKRCSEGQTWSTNTCQGVATRFTYEQALAQAKTQSQLVAGVLWRLPNVKELASLVDSSRNNPAIDMAAFPVTPSFLFWSATPNAAQQPGGSSALAWSVDFYLGITTSNNDLGNHVRLVRDPS